MDTDQGNSSHSFILTKNITTLHVCILVALKHMKAYSEVPELTARTYKGNSPTSTSGCDCVALF